MYVPELNLDNTSERTFERGCGNWYNLFMSAFIFKNQPIKSFFSSIQAYLISGNPPLQQKIPLNEDYPSAQNRQKKSLKEGVFVSSALKIQCHIVKNTLLHTAFSAILRTGIYYYNTSVCYS